MYSVNEFDAFDYSTITGDKNALKTLSPVWKKNGYGTKTEKCKVKYYTVVLIKTEKTK
jgi:hypothetical protein